MINKYYCCNFFKQHVDDGVEPKQIKGMIDHFLHHWYGMSMPNLLDYINSKEFKDLQRSYGAPAYTFVNCFLYALDDNSKRQIIDSLWLYIGDPEIDKA